MFVGRWWWDTDRGLHTHHCFVWGSYFWVILFCACNRSTWPENFQHFYLWFLWKNCGSLFFQRIPKPKIVLLLSMLFLFSLLSSDQGSMHCFHHSIALSSVALTCNSVDPFSFLVAGSVQRNMSAMNGCLSMHMEQNRSMGEPFQESKSCLWVISLFGSVSSSLSFDLIEFESRR